VFLLVVAVPALMVVVLGYVLGHGLWTCLAGMVDAAAGTSLVSGAEPAGWITGVLCLAGAARWILVRRQGPRAGRD
jgi:hypothetical protein